MLVDDILASSGNVIEEAVNPLKPRLGVHTLFSSVSRIRLSNAVFEEAHITADPYDHLGHTHQAFVGGKATCEGSMMVVTSGVIAGEGTLLVTRRSIKASPPSWAMYKGTGLSIDNVNADGFVEIGRIGHDDETCIRFRGNGTTHTIVAMRRSLGLVLHEEDITLKVNELLPSLDTSKLFSIDIQLKENDKLKYFVNNTLVFTEDLLGISVADTISNTAIPLGFRCMNTTQEYVVRASAISISSNMSSPPMNKVATLSSDTVVRTSGTARTHTAMFAIRIDRHILNNLNEVHVANDVVLDAITTHCNDEYRTLVYLATDTALTSIPLLVGWEYENGSVIEKLTGGSGSALDNALQDDLLAHSDSFTKLGEYGNERDIPNIITNLSKTGNYYLTAGMFLIVSISSDGTNRPARVTIATSEDE